MTPTTDLARAQAYLAEHGARLTPEDRALEVERIAALRVAVERMRRVGVVQLEEWR